MKNTNLQFWMQWLKIHTFQIECNTTTGILISVQQFDARTINYYDVWYALANTSALSDKLRL